MCGFTQSTCVRVPVSVNFWDISNIEEGEWCAHAEPAASKIAHSIKITERLHFKMIPLVTLTFAECITAVDVVNSGQSRSRSGKRDHDPVASANSSGRWRCSPTGPRAA